MKFLGIDYGHKRIGLAFADELKVALPIEPSLATSLKKHIDFVLQTIKARNIDAIVIGYPCKENGKATQKAYEVDKFIEFLKKRISLPVYKIDERLSTHFVEAGLSALRIGKKFSKKNDLKALKSERNSGHIDSRCAALILQDFLDSDETL